MRRRTKARDDGAVGTCRAFSRARSFLSGLIFLSSWQAGSISVGLFFLGGLLATAITLYLASRLLVSLVRRARHTGSFPLRQAVNSLYRPGNQTRVIVMAVGLGAFVIMAIQSVQTNLLNEIDLSRRTSLPSMFLIDIQPDQKQGAETLIERATGARPELGEERVRLHVARLVSSKR